MSFFDCDLKDLIQKYILKFKMQIKFHSIGKKNTAEVSGNNSAPESRGNKLILVLLVAKN